MLRLPIIAGALALLALAAPGVVPGVVPQSAQAASSCVRFVASNFDAPGDDNYMPQLNQEWVRIKNSCATAQNISGWKINDYNTIHTYKFASATSIAAGATITLHSGTGSNTATNKYWQRTYGAVWNNTGTEIAYLRNSGGTLMSTWTQ
jgi:hypothetical protein